MAHWRGEIAPGAPAFGVLSTRPREGESAIDLAARLAGTFEEPCPPRAVRVAGSRRAARIDGTIDMEEGLTEDGIERISIVVAELEDELVVLTIRTRPEDDVAAAVDALLAAFAVGDV